MNNIVIKVNTVESIIYGRLAGCFLAIRESGLVADADNFVALAYAQPCWMPVSKEASIAKHPPVGQRYNEDCFRQFLPLHDESIAQCDVASRYQRRPLKLGWASTPSRVRMKALQLFQVLSRLPRNSPEMNENGVSVG